MYRKYLVYLLLFLFGFIVSYFNCKNRVEKIEKIKEITKIDTILVTQNKITNKKDYLVYQYIERFNKVAIFEYGKYGILPSIKLSQGILESGYGKSELCKNTNNHFGVKCFGKCNNSNSMMMSDDNPYDRFKKYATSWESYRDHSIILQNKRYENCFKCRKDYKCWALHLKKGGYATSKKYTQKLISIIEKYELYKYD